MEVIAGLDAEHFTVGSEGRVGPECRPHGGIIEQRIRARLAPAVAAVDAEIIPRPGPQRVGRRLMDHAPLAWFRKWSRNFVHHVGFELVVKTHSHQVFGDAGTEVDRDRPRILRTAGRR